MEVEGRQELEQELILAVMAAAGIAEEQGEPPRQRQEPALAATVATEGHYLIRPSLTQVAQDRQERTLTVLAVVALGWKATALTLQGLRVVTVDSAEAAERQEHQRTVLAATAYSTCFTKETK